MFELYSNNVLLTSEKAIASQQIIKDVPPPLAPKQETISLVMAKEPTIPEKSSTVQILEDVLYSLKLEG